MEEETEKVQDQIQILVKEVGKEPEVRTIPNTLEALQEIVGGYIETVFTKSGLVLICDEDGKLKRKPRNFLWGDDIIVGTVFFVGNTGEDFRGLTDSEIERLKESLARR